MILLRYIMTVDSGLAPNPYHGTCTVALCTPNHGKARRLDIGDWIIGHTSNSQPTKPPKLIYAMKITEILDLNRYYHAYPEKRPKLSGSSKEQCGDAIYYRDENKWYRLPSKFHNTVKNFIQDTGNEGVYRRPVFIAKGEGNFFYFGRERGIDMTNWASLLHTGRNFSYFTDEDEINRFVKWLNKEVHGKTGRIGAPTDNVNPPDDNRYILAPNQWKSKLGPDSMSGTGGGGCGGRATKLAMKP